MAAETPNPEAPEAHFTIDGKPYEIPTLDTFTIDEAQILYDYAGLTVEDFAALDPDDDDAELDPKLRNPGFVRTLLHVAYQRGNPHLGRKRVEKLIGEMNLLEAMVELAESAADEGAGADADPPAETLELDGSSPRNSGDSRPNSGPPSESGSGEPASRPALTTVGSSPRSASIPSGSDG